MTLKQDYPSEYTTWVSMIHRCMNRLHPKYPFYGGRGITVCARWRKSFENFFADMGPRPQGLTLDRRDNDKGYTPENCRWATIKEQNNNRREYSRLNSRQQFAQRDMDKIKSILEAEYRAGILEEDQQTQMRLHITRKELHRLVQEIRMASKLRNKS